MLYLRCGVRPVGRRGVVAVLAAVSMVAIVAVVALVVDGGVIRDRSRHVQSAADAAALAAAIELFNNYKTVSAGNPDPGGAAQAAALAILQENGYTAANADITVHIPPRESQTGFNGQLRHAEVIVAFRQERYFSAIFASGNVSIRGRAVARGQYPIVDDGIIILDPDTKGALNAHGNGTVHVRGANVIVNSNHSEAAITAGNGAMALDDPNPGDRFVPGFKITGGYSGGAFTPVPTTGNLPTPDPLRSLPPPNRASMPDGSMSFVNLGGGARLYTMTPGLYNTPVSFSGQESVVMEPGIYYFEKGFSMSGQGTLTGNEVMLYNDPTSVSHGIDITGQGAVTLSPPTSGLYKGIVIYQNRRADVTVKVTGNGLLNVTGTLYAANSLLMIEGNGDVSIGSQYISRMLDLGGNGDLHVLYDPILPPRSRQLELVE